MKKYISIIFILLISVTQAYAWDTAQEEALQVIVNFEKGWEAKDLALLQSCFAELSEKQIKAYEFAFGQIDTIDLSFEIQEIGIHNKFCNINTYMSRRIKYSLTGETISDSKQVNYILMNNDGQWVIIGTVEPPEQNTEMVIPDNINRLNNILTNMSWKEQNEVFNTVVYVSEESNVIWLPTLSPGILWDVEIHKVKIENATADTLIWSAERQHGNRLAIPVSVISEMSKLRKYYAIVRFKNMNDIEFNSVVFTIKRK